MNCDTLSSFSNVNIVSPLWLINTNQNHESVFEGILRILILRVKIIVTISEMEKKRTELIVDRAGGSAEFMM